MDFDHNPIFQTEEQSQTPNGFAKASRILGFLTIAFGPGTVVMPLFAVLPLMFAMLSIAFGIVSKSQTGKFDNYAITGIVCSSVALAFMVIIAVFLLLFFSTAGGQQIVTEALTQYNDMIEAYQEFYN